jgi:CHAP domain
MTTVAASIYTAGQCTAYVAQVAPWVLQYGNLGNADTWLSNAYAAGASTGSVPLPGAVAVWGPNSGGAGPFGHVALVTKVAGDLPFVSETDWTNGPGNVDTRQVDSDVGILGYIYPPSGSSSLLDYQATTTSIPVIGGLEDAGSALTNIGSSLSYLTGGKWIPRALMIALGIGVAGFGLYILFRRQVDRVVTQVGRAASKVGEAAGEAA